MLRVLSAIGLALVLTTGGVAETIETGELKRATVMQFSVESPEADAVEIRRVVGVETKRITSCTEGFKLASWLKVRGLHGSMEVTVTPNMLLTTLPLPLRKALLGRPIGRATPVYGGQNAVRVTIRCEPAFIGPKQASPSVSNRREI